MTRKLDGEWLAFYLREGDNANEVLVNAIRRFNARFGDMPRQVAFHAQSPHQAALTEAAQRLGLEVVTGEHIPRRDFWLGPVNGGGRKA